MKIISKIGREDIALVYVAETASGKYIEFAESIQPPLPREKKWVLIVSSLFGCPVGCKFCDAGGGYNGKLSKDEIIAQIDFLVRSRFPDAKIPVEKFKIQFARMGEPVLNENVLDAIDSLDELYTASGLIPCLSTVAPKGAGKFFEKLLAIKKRKYADRFQLQFSIHTTDAKLRDWLIPVAKWNFWEIAEYGRNFYDGVGRKITLNFALADGFPLDMDILMQHFSPDIFLIKITPVNPTYRANRNKLSSARVFEKSDELIASLRAAGYETILSIGELEENKIGSNCGQYVLRHRNAKEKLADAYSYPEDVGFDSFLPSR